MLNESHNAESGVVVARYDIATGERLDDNEATMAPRVKGAVPKVYVGVRLPADLVDRLERMAGHGGFRSRSQIIETACFELLDSLDTKVRKAKRKKAAAAEEDSE